MGLGKLIYYAVVGPLALMLLLHGYTFCRHFIQTPKPVSIRSFPGTMDAAAKDLVINSRKPIIKDLLAMYQVIIAFNCLNLWLGHKG